MEKKKITWCTEEFINSDIKKTILNICKDSNNCDLKENNIIREEILVDCQIIETIDTIINIIYVSPIKSTGQPFLDVLIFNREVQIEKNEIIGIPDIVIEITKNDTGDAGNMVYQRIEKFSYLYKYGEQTFNRIEKHMIYNIEIKNGNNNVNHSIISNQLLSSLGVKIHQNEKIINIDILENIQEICKLVNNTKNNNNGNQNNRLYYINDNNIVLESNLIHSKKKKEKSNIHDPNTGFVCGLAYVLYKINPNIMIHLKNTNLYQKQLNNKSKLWCCLSQIKENITIYDRDGNIYEKDWSEACKLNSHTNYCKKSKTEKNATLFLHYKALKEGYETVFHNHGGCEQSWIYNKDNIAQRHSSKKGMPDLILRKDNNILIIEGKVINNIKKGIEQVKNNDWINSNLIKHYPKEEYKYTQHICVYGGLEHPIVNDEEVSLICSVLNNNKVQLLFNNS